MWQTLSLMGMFLAAQAVQETEVKSWGSFLYPVSNKSITSFFLTPVYVVCPNSFITEKS